MAGDLLVRGGHVVDGTGRGPSTADVEIRGGIIRRIGRVRDWHGPELDADGVTVTPGFIDLHMHYDAQMWFEPTPPHRLGTGSRRRSWATAASASRPAAARTATRCRGCSVGSRACRHQRWCPRSTSRGAFGDFLRGLEGRVGINVAGYVGHAAARRYVLDEEASEREATPDEVVRMAELVRTSMREGAVGFSTSQLDAHADRRGRPVPCNLASPDEVATLAAVVGEFRSGAVEFFPRSFMPGFLLGGPGARDVTNPTFRDPLSTLSAISTVALLALGRVLLGIGTGYTGASGRAALEAYVETGFHDHHVGDAAGLSQPDRAGRGDDDRYGRRVPCCPRS